MWILFATGHSEDICMVAKDAKGFQKSLGGDIFTVSWLRNGQDNKPATHGEKQPVTLWYLDCSIHCLKHIAHICDSCAE